MKYLHFAVENINGFFEVLQRNKHVLQDVVAVVHVAESLGCRYLEYLVFIVPRKHALSSEIFGGSAQPRNKRKRKLWPIGRISSSSQKMLFE